MKRGLKLLKVLLKKHKNIIVFAAVIIFTALFVYFGNALFKNREQNDDNIVYCKAKIISIVGVDKTTNDYGNEIQLITFTAKIKSGPKKGSEIYCTQVIDSTYMVMQDKAVGKGNSILLIYMVDPESGIDDWTFAGYNRADALMVLCGIFLLLILIIGRKKGLNTIISLVSTCLIIFFVYIPSIISGFNVYLSTAVCGVVIIFTGLLLINGANKKTLCAIFGNLCGVLIAALLAFVMTKVMKMTGFLDEQYVFLSFVSSEKPLNLVAIIWGGMVIGALGAIMDVAMSIASSMHELAEHMSDRSFLKMLRSGMNIGRDAIGTMTNTLILAYIGGSLALVLLLLVYTKDMLHLFSLEMIAAEVVQAITGSMGILFAVPFTALCAAYMYNKKSENFENECKKQNETEENEIPAAEEKGEDAW